MTAVHTLRIDGVELAAADGRPCWRWPGSTTSLHCLEKLDALLRDDTILDRRVRATAGINANEGIGVAEAPRGTLLHH